MFGCGSAQSHDDDFQVELPQSDYSNFWQAVYTNNIKSIPQVVIEKCYLQADYCIIYSHGTGFVVEDNTVVTANHLAEEYLIVDSSSQPGEIIYYQLYLRYPATTDENNNYFLPEQYYVEAVATLPNRDIAFLQVNTLGNPPVWLYQNDWFSLNPQQPVMLVSYPGSHQFVGSEGIINKLFYNDGLASWVLDDTRLIEDNAPADHGSSGGPLFNQQGQIIGMHFAGYNYNHDLFLSISADHFRNVNTNNLGWQTRQIPTP